MPEGNCKGLRILFEYKNENNFPGVVRNEIVEKFIEIGVTAKKLKFDVEQDSKSNTLSFLTPRDNFTLRQFISYAEHFAFEK